METVGTPLLWAGFLALIGLLLALDLGVFHRRPHAIGSREALAWSLFWIALAMLFNLWVWHQFGPRTGLEFLTGYVVEKALSVDNIFVFAVIFSYFGVPREYQHRVLFWGIVGAVVLRGIFILVGATLLYHFHWIVYVFGAFLLLTGIRILLHRHEQIDPERNPLVGWVRRHVPMTPRFHGQRFFVREGGRLVATPLLLVLVVVEATDVVFAVDSVPAIFAVTRDPFIVFTSNIFAILGLRALYFLLAAVIHRFRYLKPALGFVLVFIGVKMGLSEIRPIPTEVSLAVVLATLSVAVVASWLRERRLRLPGASE